MHEPGDPGVPGGPGEDRGALDGDLLLDLPVGPHRVHGGDHRVGTDDDLAGQVGVEEVAHVLGDAVQGGRGPGPADDGADLGAAGDEGMAEALADQTVGTGDDHDGRAVRHASTLPPGGTVCPARSVGGRMPARPVGTRAA